jgi:hypothetical protein
MSTPSIVDRMSATDVRKPPIAESDGDREAVVSVRDLVKRFSDVEAVRGVSFDVAPGEAFASRSACFTSRGAPSSSCPRPARSGRRAA